MIGNGGGQVDGQLAIFIELSILLGGLIARIVVGVGASRGCAHIFVRVVPDGQPVAGPVDGVLDLGASHGFAEVVTGIEVDGNAVALEHARVGGLHAHFVFGLLVFLHLEIAIHLLFADFELNTVVAQRSVGGQGHVVVDGAGGAGSQRLAVDGFLIGVLDDHGNALAGRNPITRAAVHSQNSFEMDGMAGAVDGAIGVDVAGPLAGRAVEHAGVNAGDGEILAAAGHQAEILAGGRRLAQLSHAVRIRFHLLDGLVAHHGSHPHALERLAAGPVEQQIHDPPVVVFGDHYHVGNDQEGVGAQLSVYGFHQVHAFVGDADGDGFFVPAGMALYRLVEREHHLLRVEQRGLGKMRALGAIGGRRSAAREGAFKMGAGRFGELGAQRTAYAGTQGPLPGMNSLEPGKAARRRRRLLAEAVRVLDLLEELDGVVNPVDAKLDRVHVPGADRDRRLAMGRKRATGRKREVGLVFGLAEAAGGHSQNHGQLQRRLAPPQTKVCATSWQPAHRWWHTL